MAKRKQKKQTSPTARTIKRYGNRKLYDTQQSHYVTLEEISRMVRKGADIRVVDNRTGEDLTTIILTQIMLEEEKAKRSALPISLLKNIIQLGEESLTEWVQRGRHSISSMTTEGREQLSRILEKGHETRGEGALFVKEWLANQQRALDLAQKKIDERIRYFFQQLTGLDDLEKQIQELEDKISRLEGALPEPPDPDRRPDDR